MRIGVRGFCAEEFVVRVDWRVIIFRVTHIAIPKIGQNESIPPGVGNVVRAGTTTNGLHYLVKDQLSKVQRLVLDDTEKYLLLKKVYLIVTAVLGCKTLAMDAGQKLQSRRETLTQHVLGGIPIALFRDVVVDDEESLANFIIRGKISIDIPNGQTQGSTQFVNSE